MAVASASRRQQHAEATRTALLEAAETLIAEHGYADVSIDEICVRAGVTKGALYHHFESKRDLFRALCAYVEDSWVDEMVEEVSGEQDPLRRLMMGCDAFLEGCLDPARQRILVLDGPAVLGGDPMHSGRGAALLGHALGEAMDAGEIERQPIAPLARLLYGALTEASTAIARDNNQARARKEMGAALRRLIEGLGPGS
jgi:AcrR family transcriptional regulator